MTNLEKLKKLSVKELKTIKAGANGITDGTNYTPPAIAIPTTQQCTGGCTATINTKTGEFTQTGGTWTFDY